MTRLALLAALLLALLLAWSLWPRVDDVVQVETVPATESFRAAVPVGAVREFLAVVATTTTTAKPTIRSAPKPRPAGDPWTALAQCESGGNPRAVSKSGRYRGAFQFDLDSYRRAGGSGDPISHSYAEQLRVAKRWQQLTGWHSWPTCARRLGLI